MNTDTKYFEVRTIRELHGIYYVAAASREEAEEFAWEKFDDEIYREEWDLRPSSSDWEYETITERADKNWNEEWLVADGGEV